MNLIITCARHLEPETEEELRDILEEYGDSDVKISITKMSGILTVETKLEPIQVVKKIKEMLLDEPWSIRYCLRIIPIQKMIETRIEEIEKTVTELSNQILEEETYRISIEKRNSDLSSKEIISKIANKIKNKVSLEYPDKVILIEILGNKTGISILRKSDILSTEKTKRSISE
ncbi:MAG: THUMP domain-containing protein [Nitrosopumilus sp.]|nr:THUMP domain-containing protein [Nitrosopumilus sp.]MDH3764366.1 THUMP domain-containing protein [Nitrosopumilus sp.]